MKWETIKKDIDNYEQTSPDYNPSFAPYQEDIISLVDHYWVSKFRDGDYASGFKKAFYNIIIKPVLVAAKLIDLDTKDIRVIAEDGQSYYPSWLMGKELKIWMKDQKNKWGQTFGQILNELVYNWPKYGHVLVKKAKGSIFLVPLQTVINDPIAKNFMESERLIIKHEVNYDQLRGMRYDPDLTEYVITKYGEDEGICIYEVFGPCGCENGHNYHVMAEKSKDEDILFHDTVDREDVFKELKWEEIPGRALGRGQSEKLFENQIAKNQDENLFRAGLRWTSKHIFQTRDDTIAKNLLEEIENGEVILANSEITPIAVEERNLNSYRNSDVKWDQNTNDVTFSYESVSGERPPAGTPLGTTILQSQQAGAFFDMKREELGMFIKEILMDWIIPDFKKNNKKEHKIMVGAFEEDEVDKLRGLLINNKFNKSIFKNIKKNGSIPNAEERQILKGIVSEQISKSRDITIPENFYEDLKYKIDVVITNEQIDMASRMTTLQTVLQIIGSNPTILQDKRSKKIFYKLLDLAGISPTELDISEDQPDLLSEVSQVAQRGGSVARSVPAGPGNLRVPTTL